MYKKIQLYTLVAPSFKFDEDTDLCHICMDLLLSPIKCSHCGARFCKACADKWNKGAHRCPNKCTEKWEYTEIPSLKIKLICPFGCETLVFPQKFIEHLRGCEKAPEIYKNEFSEEDMKLNYRCKNNHCLSFIQEIQDIPLNLNCAICHQHKLVCRNICNTCLKNGEQYYSYCCNCRPPKGLTKTCCPVGHTDMHVKASSSCSAGLCDVCSKPLKDNGLACVADQTCHLSICMKCFQELEDGNGIGFHHSMSSNSHTPTQSPQLSRNSSSKYSSEDDNDSRHFKH